MALSHSVGEVAIGQGLEANCSPPPRCAACGLPAKAAASCSSSMPRATGSARWYASCGAERLQGSALTLVMPSATFATELRAKGLP